MSFNLQQVIERCQLLAAQNQHPVVVFDLDHTLFDNGPRSIAILNEFAHKNNLPQLTTALTRLHGQMIPYSVRDVLADLKACEEEVVEAAMDHWWQRFFTDEYQKHDVPVLGAVEFVKRVYESGALVVYLSGRNAPNMLVGCTASLREHGFPIGLPKTTLVLKPDFNMSDYLFKRDAATYIGNLGPVIASFDNEPENCNLFAEMWPDAYSVWLATTHSKSAPPLHAAVRSIPHF